MAGRGICAGYRELSGQWPTCITGGGIAIISQEFFEASNSELVARETERPFGPVVQIVATRRTKWHFDAVITGSETDAYSGALTAVQAVRIWRVYGCSRWATSSR